MLSSTSSSTLGLSVIVLANNVSSIIENSIVLANIDAFSIFTAAVVLNASFHFPDRMIILSC